MNIQNLDTSIYKVIKRLRIAKSLSQEKLAHLANKDRTYISSIERKERNISLKTLIDILTALDVDFETFLKELHDEKL
jgi:transcriptional regulator with XRE-family HTH domain